MSDQSSDAVSPKRTSGEHYECVLQQLVSFVSVSLSFFRVSVFPLAQTEMAKRSGEREVRQLGKISVVLQSKTKAITHRSSKAPFEL